MKQHQQAEQWPPWLPKAAVIGILVIGLLLRFAPLGSKSLWFDEAYSVSHAAEPMARIWPARATVADPHPPLYYAGLHYWQQVAGQSEAAVRFPSAVISAVNLGLLYLLGRRLFGQAVGLLAVTLQALSPLDLWYAQEARMYIFVTGIGLLLALALSWRPPAFNYKGADANNLATGSTPAFSSLLWFGSSTLLLALITTAGFYLDYTVLPLWLGLSVLFLIDWWQSGRNGLRLLAWLGSAVIAWWLFQPWLPHLQRTIGDLNRIFIFDRLQRLFGLPAFATWHYLMLLVLGICALLVIALLSQRLLRHKPGRRWLGPLTIILFALATVLLAIPRFYTVKRLLVIGWPLVILLVAWLIMQLELRRWQRPIWSILILLSLAATLVTVFFVPKDDWRGAVAYVNANIQPTDIVWLDPFWIATAYNYYQPTVRPRTERTDELEAVVEGGREDDGRALSHHIWIIAERNPGQPIPSWPSEAWLDDRLTLVEAIPFYRLEVRRYLIR